MVFLEVWLEAWGSSQVASGESSLLPSCEGELSIPLEVLQKNQAYVKLKQETRGFSQVSTGILGFLLSCNGDLSELLYLPQRSQATFCVVCGNLGFLLSQSRGFRHH